MKKYCSIFTIKRRDFYEKTDSFVKIFWIMAYVVVNVLEMGDFFGSSIRNDEGSFHLVDLFESLV